LLDRLTGRLGVGVGALDEAAPEGDPDAGADCEAASAGSGREPEPHPESKATTIVTATPGAASALVDGTQTSQVSSGLSVNS
jgi:hypothetical protein